MVHDSNSRPVVTVRFWSDKQRLPKPLLALPLALSGLLTLTTPRPSSSFFVHGQDSYSYIHNSRSFRTVRLLPPIALCTLLL